MARPKKLYKVTDKCIICGLCKANCTFDAIEEGTSVEGFPKMLVLPDMCRGCKVCYDVCPVQAIDIGTQPELADRLEAAA